MAKQPKIDIGLHPKQAEVFASDANEILYGGAAGGGKSHLLRCAAIIWACQIPGIQIYLFRRTFSDLEKNHLNGPSSFPALLAPYIDTGLVSWNKQKYTFTFWNGSTVHLCHCQRESDRWNYQGAELHVLLIDELAHFTATIYKFLRGRVRMVGITVPPNVVGRFPKIVCGSNPGGPGHNFMKSNWVDRAPPGQIWKAPDIEGGMYRQFVRAMLNDNPSMAEEDPSYTDRLRGLGDPALVRAMLEGSFDIVSGGMFDDVWTPNAHIIDPFEIPQSWYLDRAFDMGSSKPFSVGWFAESDGSRVELADGTYWTFPRGSVFQIGEWYGWNGEPDEGLRLTPPQIAQGIRQRELAVDLKFRPGPADTAIWDGDDYNKAPIQDFIKLGINWVKADKRPGSRVNGWLRMRSMFRAATEYPMERPGLFIFSNCTHTIRTLPVATRSKTNAEDIDTAQEDHALDMLRYRILGGKMEAKPSNIRPF